MDDRKESNSKDRFNNSALSLGFSITGGVAVFALLGVYCDRRFHTSPIGLIAGILLGFLYSAYEVWKAVRETNGTNGINKNSSKTDKK